MPRRRRGQEFKRRLRKEVASAEGHFASADALAAARADPLHDIHWLTPHDPDDDCYRYCPHFPPEEAQDEIDAYLNRRRT